MAMDLAGDSSLKVTAADFSNVAVRQIAERAAKLGLHLHTAQCNASDAGEVEALARSFDLVCCALPSRFAYSTVQAILRAKRPVCDISFVTENLLALDSLAKGADVSCVVDFGVAPGMSHVLAASAAAELADCQAVRMFVGGLPVERRWPFSYKAAFSPSDVIEEYTRPARLVEANQIVMREALSEPELMDLPGVGTLEAFNTDGLRSMADTYLGKIPFMKEKTLRYPGHTEQMRVLREVGLFGTEPVSVSRAGASVEDAVSVVPRDLIAKLMFPMWTYQPGERDLTVMRVEASGKDAHGHARTIRYDVLDYSDAATGFSSMARTTAFPCAIMARRILSGEYARKGVSVPEFVGQDQPTVDALLRDLAARGVVYRKSTL